MKTEYKMHLELMACYARHIAMLPLEKMLEDLNHAEAVGPLIDPTLAREYFNSERGPVIKEILEACIKLKRAVEKAQPLVQAEMQREKNGEWSQ